MNIVFILIGAKKGRIVNSHIVGKNISLRYLKEYIGDIFRISSNVL
jgi:hypothetical protein